MSQVSGASPPAGNGLDITKLSDGTLSVGGMKMSLNEAVFYVLAQRAATVSSLAEGRVSQMQDQLTAMNSAKKVLDEMKNLKNKSQDGGPQAMPEDVEKWLKTNGVTVSSDSSGTVVLKGNYVAKKYDSKQWETNMNYLQTKVDSMTQDQQLQYIKLKSYVDKANDATEGASSQVSKMEQTQSFIMQKF